MSNRQVVGGWYAVNNGFQPGKQVEYEVYQVQTEKGGTFNTFKLFKPFQMQDRNQQSATFGQQIWVQGTSFPVDAHVQIIDRINHMIAGGFTQQQGMYVFQPGAVTVAQPAPQQQQMAFAPQQQPPQTPAYQQQQQYAQQANAQQPQGGQYQPPPNVNPQGYNNNQG